MFDEKKKRERLMLKDAIQVFGRPNLRKKALFELCKLHGIEIEHRHDPSICQLIRMISYAIVDQLKEPQHV